MASGGSTLLDWSYTVAPVGNITSISDLLNPANNRTFAYQDFYYFLTQGNGPWGPRAWTYDRIGNRLTEVRGAATDTYSYPFNAGGGRNPKLQSVAEGDGGARQYSYDEAGNTQQVLDYDPDQRLDLIHDGAGLLSFMRFRAPEEKLVALTYDGRGFLSKAEDAGGGCFAQQTLATYNSEGVLHRREHRLVEGGGSIPVDSDMLFYFDGKPLTALNQNGEGSDLTFLSVDHLGSPILASDDTETLLWQGGFEPFGKDYSGGSEAGIFLRFPGQWEDDVWSAANLQNGLSYNLHRWYQSEVGRYIVPELRTFIRPHLNYTYVLSSPIVYSDPDGLTPKPSTGKWCGTSKANAYSIPLAEPCPDCNVQKAMQRLNDIDALRQIKCQGSRSGRNGRGGTSVEVAGIDQSSNSQAWYIPQGDACVDYCLCVHETLHLQQVHHGDLPPGPPTVANMECAAYTLERQCLGTLLSQTFRVRLPI